LEAAAAPPFSQTCRLDVAGCTMAIDFQKIIFFGDSLTDDGNLPAPVRPQSPYVGGRFTNGPVYAEVLTRELGVASDNFALGGAEASTDSGDATAQRLINLSAQIDTFRAQQSIFSLAGFGGHVGPGTAASILIGGNDIINERPDTRAEASDLANRISSSIALSSLKLVQTGIQHVVFYTLPFTSYTPQSQDLTPAAVTAADATVTSVNNALKNFAQQASAFFETTVVDLNRLETEIADDRDTFGIKVIDTPLFDNVRTNLHPTGIQNQFSPDEVAFFDPIHPTATVHAIIGAFSEATLRADRVTLRGAGDQTVVGSQGSDLVFAGAGSDRVSGRGGNDVLFSGTGDDKVDAGNGHDLVAGGSGNDIIRGRGGSDLIAGNAGDDQLFGGFGPDVLIDGTGANSLFGQSGDDAFIFTVDGVGSDVISGGTGTDTLQLLVSAAFFADAAFQAELQDYSAALAADPHAAFSFNSLGLLVDSIERLEVHVDGKTVFSAGHAPVAPSTAVASLLHDASLWNLV
jgi:phospholipase/lecithinase/hemolysin